MECDRKKTGGATVSSSSSAEVISANSSAKFNACLEALEPSRATRIFLTKHFPPTYEMMNANNKFS